MMAGIREVITLTACERAVLDAAAELGEAGLQLAEAVGCHEWFTRVQLVYKTVASNRQAAEALARERRAAEKGEKEGAMTECKCGSYAINHDPARTLCDCCWRDAKIEQLEKQLPTPVERGALDAAAEWGEHLICDLEVSTGRECSGGDTRIAGLRMMIEAEALARERREAEVKRDG